MEDADADADVDDANGDAEPVFDQEPDVDENVGDGDGDDEDGDGIDDADDADDADVDEDGDADAEAEAGEEGDADADAEAGEGEDADADAEAEAERGQPGPNSPAHPTGLTESQRVVDSGPKEEKETWQQDAEAQAPAVPDFASILRPSVRPEAITATNYDIVPTIAAPHNCSVNAITSTADARWVFSGGADGFVRKYNWVDSVNAKSMLTVAQRHPFVDSVTKSGLLMSYWENMDGQMLSPVYSLAAQSEGLWLLSGLASGGIRLQSIRHDEGKEITTLKHHTSAVSSLVLSPDERALLSGSWDKQICDWDLDTGQIRQQFAAGVGQVSSIQMRSESSDPLPIESMNTELQSDTFSANDNTRGRVDTSHRDGDKDEDESNYRFNKASRSPADSLFGGADSLFGDTDPITSFDQVDQFDASQSRTEDPINASQGDVGDITASAASINADPVQNVDPTEKSDKPNGFDTGLPKSEEEVLPAENDSNPSKPPTSNAIFLSSSIDGTIRVWDRRQPSPLARVKSRNAPPWCTNACWSIDGQYIYAGRRNNMVEEFSLHKGLKEPVRTFKFPSGSGAVTALQAMPNGKHLLCASYDNLRLYNLQADLSSRQFAVPFLIVPGHRTGVISQLYLDRTCRFILSAGGNRGWDGSTTEVLLGYEIGIEN